MQTTARHEPARVVRIIARTNVGGPSLQITALMRHLDRSRYEQHLLAGFVDEGEADYLDLRAPDVAVTRVPGLGRGVKLTGDLRAFLTLVRHLRRLRPAIVHTHTAKAGTLGRLASVVARVPVRVHTFHGHVLTGYFGRAGTFAVVSIERVLRLVTTHSVVVGANVRSDLIAAHVVSPHRSSVIAPGVVKPAPIERSAARFELGLQDGHTVVVFVGRLTAIKRAERFVEVARSLAGEPDITFAVVGDGPLRAELEAAGVGLDNLVFVGWRSDLAAVYAAADLIVLTSDNEGMPVVLIEAAMQGVPAVSTRVGSVDQVVLDGETGTLVAAGDASQLLDAVTTLVHDGELRDRFGRAAAAHALASFSEERLVQDYDDLYARLLDDSRSRERGRRASSADESVT